MTGRDLHEDKLLTYYKYKRIGGNKIKIASLLVMSGIEDASFNIPKWQDVAQKADFF